MNCPRCNAQYSDPPNFCSTCGAPIRAATAARPSSTPPAYPNPAPPQVYHPGCPLCRSPYLQYFSNGKGVCSVCKHIFRWSYAPTGQLFLMPDTGLF